MLRKPLRANAARQQVARGTSIPAPVGGWDAVSALADMPANRAIVLDNWFPSTSDVRVRRGHQVHCGAMGTGPVDSLLVYNGVTAITSRLFAATNGRIFDVTASGGSVEAIDEMTSNRWQYVNFTTIGGKYLWICNGIDAPMHFDGSAWASPIITGIAANEIIQVNAHKKRLWFVLRESTKAAYLETGAIAGAATTFELGSLFTKGGYLVAMATWTRDGGDGEDDLAVFISSEGQVAVYAGTDPTSDTTWALIGVFDLGQPIGTRCFTKVAGDLALINIDGVLPLSKALETDRGAAKEIAITANINNAMNEAARTAAGNFGWELCPYPKGTYVILNVPLQEGQTQHQYVMNTLTGAWCRFKGQNANCWAVFGGNLFFGGNEGLVFQADTTSMDLGAPIDAIGQGAYNYYKARGSLKQWNMLQPMLTTDSNARPAIGISTDFKDNAVLGTPTAGAISAALYDSAIWDVDVYSVDSRAVTDWAGVSGLGICASIHFRARTGLETGLSLWGQAQWGTSDWSAPIPSDAIMRLNGFNVIYQTGGFM